jgi:hypothetical protein
MESSLNKIILVQYNTQISDFSHNILKYITILNTQKIVRYYISDIKENMLIIEVILKDL